MPIVDTSIFYPPSNNNKRSGMIYYASKYKNNFKEKRNTIFSKSFICRSNFINYKNFIFFIFIINIEKNFQFDYLEFEPIIYRDNQFDSKISSLFAFYINIIVGIDHDSFVIKSVNYFYDISKKILNYANQSNVPGWNSSHNGGKFNKFWLIEYLTSNDSNEFSNFLFNYHVNGLDLMHSDIFSAKKNIANSISSLKSLQQRKPNSILLKILFDSKSDEIKDIFSGGSFFDVTSLVSDLNYLNPFLSNKWNSIR